MGSTISHSHNAVSDERAISALLSNLAIGGDQQIAEFILEKGQFLSVAKGAKLMEQGSLSDEVFFLIIGEVEVLEHGAKTALRTAPSHVGELSAKDPAKERSATVKVRSKELVAIKLDGDRFRDLLKKHPTFSARLSLETEARFRERISAQKIQSENWNLLWTLISIVSSIVVSVLVYWLVVPVDWSQTARITTSLAAGFTWFFIILLRNPALLWRNLGYIAGLALISFVLLERNVRFSSTNGTIGDTAIEFISRSSKETWESLLLKLGALLTVLIVAGFLDRLQNKR